jgi:ribonuclease D
MIPFILLLSTSLLVTTSMENAEQRATDAQIRRAAGSHSLSKLKETLETGWTANDINNQEGKSCVHMAAWQGCLGNLRYLVEEIGCDINCYSSGEFSYGKTAIFFAATRNRSHVVDYLLDQGAWVKIVNNKGQSVLSIASSHLTPQIISKIQEKEKLQEGRVWLNFRTTHSDGFEYGDLDPRFLDRSLRPEDVVTPLAVNPTTKETRKGGFLSRNPQLVNQLIKPKQQPRKKKQVVSSLSKEESTEVQHAWERVSNALKRKQEINCSQDLLRIVQLGDKQRKAWIPDAADNLRKYAMGDLSIIEALLESSSMLASKRESDLLHKLLLWAKEPGLYLKERLSSVESKRNAPPRTRPRLDSQPWDEACSFVDGLSISLLEKADVSILCSPYRPVWVDSTEILQSLRESLERQRLVAFDSEWYDVNDKETAVATLQVAYQEHDSVKSFVIDLLPTDSKFKHEVQDFVRWLFSSDLLLLGFSPGHDIPKLENFVGGPLRHDTLDLQLLMATKESCMPGLKACVALFAPETPLSKDEQCSDWRRRPLSKPQLDYAGLDAAILLFLLAEQKREEARRSE